LWPTLLLLFATQWLNPRSETLRCASRLNLRNHWPWSVTLAGVRRRLFNILSVASLVLCVATCALWWRCYVVAYELSYMPTLPTYVEQDVEDVHVWRQVGLTKTDDLSVTRGRIAVSHGYADGRTDRWEFRAFKSDADLPAKRFGFGWGKDYLVAPLWAIVGFSATAPVLVVALRFRRSALRTSLCPSCGYDLRATPDRCPECGTFVVARASRPCESLKK
jgi:predicted RNA-binding Zn-ribbon protein involved in translation (DUF1610 family)